MDNISMLTPTNLQEKHVLEVQVSASLLLHTNTAPTRSRTAYFPPRAFLTPSVHQERNRRGPASEIGKT